MVPRGSGWDDAAAAIVHSNTVLAEAATGMLRRPPATRRNRQADAHAASPACTAAFYGITPGRVHSRVAVDGGRSKLSTTAEPGDAPACYRGDEVTVRTMMTIGRLRVLVLLTLALGASAREAAAQGFISPSVGYNFGGNAGCRSATDCRDKNWNLGIGIGALGGIAGFEFELMYDDEFFGETGDQSSSVLTMMGNFMLAPKFGPIQPYGLVGMGAIKTSLEIAGDAVEEERTQFGWDIGGGLIIFFGEHVGLRGDLRYFHSFETLDLFDLNLPFDDDERLDFGRASAAVVFKF
jgi:hypothetical protein